MTTKSHNYSKHKEFKEFSSSGNAHVPPYTDEQFDMIKSELIPKGSKLETLGNGGAGAREYHYEYKEEKHPSGKYDRKDLHTVEQYTIPPKTVPKKSESSSYYYEREERELPAITSGTRTYHYDSSTSSTPGYSKVKSSKVTKELSQNVEELDSLLDDLQKDQERQLYKSGYASDTAESTSFDYKRGTPAKAPSSGYSTLRREERVENWNSSPPPPRTTEIRQELFKEETIGTSKKREERLESSSSWNPSPPPRTTAELRREEMYREETTESRVVPAVPVAAPACTHCHHTPVGTLTRGGPMNKVTTTVKTYTYEVPAGADPAALPLPTQADHHHTYVTNEALHTTNTLAPSPSAGCQYCSHCNSHTRDLREYRSTNDSERVVHLTPANHTVPVEPRNGPTSYKYSETSYSAHNSTQRYPPSPSPARLESPPGAFPRPSTPSAGNQQTPTKLDDLLADFPEARFPTQPEGVYRRKVEVSHESSRESRDTRDGRTPTTPAAPPTPSGKNVAGPAVYYPPGHTPFAKKPEAQVQGYQTSSAMQGGGAHASGRGMYEYESGSRTKEKHSERKTAVPVCLPLCCAMPCVIM